ncbi:hypothetical protein [Ferrimonas marina]|uniref:Uncharacterized protein n=1 Tax=Ferrimonas marina TaxID=299255 RepID=A0A1M5UG71_9GAMM|nr:hypothetical protein [Ferrimonas marina]SHH61920.1 hypothetical protein SAMN02745129_2553 [Ferrimonas marina]
MTDPLATIHRLEQHPWLEPTQPSTARLIQIQRLRGIILILLAAIGLPILHWMVPFAGWQVSLFLFLVVLSGAYAGLFSYSQKPSSLEQPPELINRLRLTHLEKDRLDDLVASQGVLYRFQYGLLTHLSKCRRQVEYNNKYRS